MIRVTAAIIEKGDKILIARRKEGKLLAGYWEFPGGKIEAGESPEACLQRELFEEFAIQSEVKEFIADSIYQYPMFTIQLLGYRVIHLNGDFKLTDHDRLEWVTLNEIDNFQLAPADLPILYAYHSSTFR
jgi:8-oxo-dGTP diphosphatase